MISLVLAAAYGAAAGSGVTLLVRYLKDRRIKNTEPVIEEGAAFPEHIQEMADTFLTQRKLDAMQAMTEFRVELAEGDAELSKSLVRIENGFKRRIGDVR